MSYRTLFLSAALGVCVSAPAFGQDAVKVDPGHYKSSWKMRAFAWCGSAMRQGRRA